MIPDERCHFSPGGAAVERSMFEKLAAPETKKRYVLQDFTERVDVIVAGPAFIAVQHIVDGSMHEKTVPSVFQMAVN